MTIQDAKDYLPLVQALADGKTIQVQTMSEGWIDVSNTNFDLPRQYYRIKPKPRRWWILFSLDRAMVYNDEDSARRYATIAPNEIIEVQEVLK